MNKIFLYILTNQLLDCQVVIIQTYEQYSIHKILDILQDLYDVHDLYTSAIIEEA